MNKFVRVAGITIASVLVVAGTVWAQTPSLQWKAPQGTFPNMPEINVPIDTGNVKQPRGGVISFTSSSETYPLLFSTGQGIDASGGLLPLRGNLNFIASSGIVFSDNSYQTSAGKYQNAKLCRVIMQQYVPGTTSFDGSPIPPVPPIYDTILARDSWTVADCVKYGKDATAGYSYPVKIGCAYPGGSFGKAGFFTVNSTAFGAPTAAGYWDKTTLPANCGWDAPPPPPPPGGGTTVPERPACNWKQWELFPERCNIP